MNSTHETRVWLGWRKPAAEGGPADWDAFRKVLGQRFLPETWRVMSRYGLLAYGPSVLSEVDDAEALPWPDETAVLVYRSVQAYAQSRDNDDGMKYNAMHGEVFTKKGGPRGSRSDWAQPVPSKPDSPLRRMAGSGGADFSQHDATLSVLFLSAPETATAEALMACLPADNSEAVVWCTQGMTIVWLASRQPLDQDEVSKPLRAAWPGIQVHQFHTARVVLKLLAQGVAVQDNTSWRMCAGVTEIET